MIKTKEPLITKTVRYSTGEHVIGHASRYRDSKGDSWIEVCISNPRNKFYPGENVGPLVSFKIGNCHDGIGAKYEAIVAEIADLLAEVAADPCQLPKQE